MESEQKKKVIDALVGFVVRVSEKSDVCTSAEMDALPSVAEILLTCDV